MITVIISTNPYIKTECEADDFKYEANENILFIQKDGKTVATYHSWYAVFKGENNILP